MSQDVLVIPFSEVEADILDRFCEKQVEEMTQDRLEALIFSFLTRKIDVELMTAFEDFCKDEEYGGELSLAAIITVLSENIVLQTIENVKSNKERALYSLLLKNALILAVKGNGFVAYPKALFDTFGIYHDYIADEKIFDEEDGENELIQSVLDSDDDALAETINNADCAVVKSIVYDAASYQYEKIVGGLKVEADNPVKGIYQMVKRLVVDAPWVYIDQEPAKTIKKILGNACETEFTLSKVIEDLSDEDDMKDGKEYLTTSVLLRIISGHEEGIELCGETRFTAAELAVYLYYELLAEALSEEINEIEE